MMKYRIYRYRLESREGLLVEYIDEEGRRGVGEVAPLPGWSRESLEDAEQQLIYRSEGPYFPSVAFGLESAQLAAPKLPLAFPINRLLSGSAREMLLEAEGFAKRGALCFKLKLGSLGFHEAIEVVRALKGTFRLRLDLNRRWSLQQSLRFFSAFSPEDYEYVEEPCSNPSDLAYFPYPFAADESLRELPLEEILAYPSLKALIFKPTLQGGIRVGELLAQAAKKHGIDLILSSAHESGVGITQIALLAHHLELTHLPLGLDTYRFLKSDLLQNPLEFSENALHLKDPLFALKSCSVQLLHEESLDPMHSLQTAER